MKSMVIQVFKRKSKKNSPQSIEVELSIPKVSVTKVSLMTVVLLLIFSLVGYSGYLGVKSIWNFTHPKFNISLDTFKALGYIAQGQSIPPFPLPTFAPGEGPDSTETAAFNEALNAFKSDFRSKFPNSRLNQLSPNVLLGIGWSFCKAKQESITESGEYSAPEIIKAHQAKLFIRYPFVAGLNEFVEGVGNVALENLCKGN